MSVNIELCEVLNTDPETWMLAVGNFVQCNLDYLDLVYPAPGLPGHSQTQAMH